MIYLPIAISLLGAASAAALPAAPPGQGFDIVPCSLPNCADGEVRFEEPRDITRVVVEFEGKAPEGVGLSYLQRLWPDHKVERDWHGADNAMSFGWYPIEDWFNCDWRTAATGVRRLSESTLEFSFRGLRAEFADSGGYDVTFRRTQGLRVDAPGGPAVRSIKAYTASPPATSSIRVMMDAGKKTDAASVAVSGYNATVVSVKPVTGVSVSGGSVTPGGDERREFVIDLSHMTPAHRFCGDDGLVTFSIRSGDGEDAFTISLESLRNDGPIWYAEEGFFITRADDPVSFEDYRARFAGKKTIASRVTEMPEQSLGGAMNGQPKPHADSFVAGCKNARQRFRIEPNGDIHMARMCTDWVGASDTPRNCTSGDARFFFGLERMRVAARYPDPAPVMAFNTRFLSDSISVEQRAFAVPLLKSALDEHLVGDDTIVAIVTFTFTNTGDRPATARLPIGYSSEAGRSADRMAAGGQNNPHVDGNRVPRGKRDALAVEAAAGQPDMKVLTSAWGDGRVIRCALSGSMNAAQAGDDVLLTRELDPGESCSFTLKIPFISLTRPEELKALAELDPASAYRDMTAFWRSIGRLGARINTPEPRLNALYASHFAHVSIADLSMPAEPYLINTSVGSSIYGNYTNESCMIIEELDQRGLHEEARRRLTTWLRYQGTVGLRGRFSDHDGVFYGAGGFESGETYDQHHGWALWYLAEHYFQTRDDAWMKSIADAVIKGADWVFRQRRQTMQSLPNSRGWEYGFLPAGSLEDVADFFYWLSTNSVTWRGVDSAASALEAIGHPEAARVRREADAYGKDLRTGFEKSRQQSPLVMLRDGRWVPHYPSRLYRRGRDSGWIREILEGSVYLLISGLYNADSKQAGWILDDFQDNRYMSPDFGYPVFDASRLWFDVGGFSAQPNLLAGLMPHLDRDEPEVYIWMFLNAWAACYREDVCAMVEHPQPILGHSNCAIVKTSDQANAMKWLSYMFVYGPEDGLYLGRAIPREWLSGRREISAEGLCTRYGEVSVRYKPEVDGSRIACDAELALKAAPGRVVVRFRHPEKKPIQSVTVNGEKWDKFDAGKGDVDITGLSGAVRVEAGF